jgi:predicted anti-sigma-YlaC factor YlaD
MENRFEHNPPEERTDWGKYVTPPNYGRLEEQNVTPLQRTLCVRVREMLPHLLENDGTIRPEMATAVYGHLSVCPHCSHEFEEMQRVVALVEALAPPEMTQDFAPLIMQRIQSNMTTLHDGVPLRPLSPAGSSVSSAPVHDAPKQKSVKVTRGIQTTHQQQTTQNFSVLESATQTGQRLLASVILMTVIVFFLSTAWGREVLGVTLESATHWLGQIVGGLKSTPLVGSLADSIYGTLTQIGETLASSYRILGANAVRGLAIDAALCAGGYYFLVARRNNKQKFVH